MRSKRSRTIRFRFEKALLLAIQRGETISVQTPDDEERVSISRPASGAVFLFDEKYPGLAVRVPASGDVRFWLYAWINGKAVKRSLGPLAGPDGWSVDRARAETLTEKARILEGREPETPEPASSEEAPAPTGPTLGSAFADYIRGQKRTNRTWRDNVRQFRKYLKEHAKRPLAEVDAKWLQALHERISDEEGHPGAANRLLAMVSKMLRIAQGLPPKAPTAASFVPRNKEEERHRRLKKEEEAILLRAIDEFESEPVRVSGNAGTDPADWPEYRKPKDPAKWPAHMRPKTPEAMEEARAAQREKLEAMRAKWRANLARKEERARKNRSTAADLLRVLYWTGQRAGDARAMEWSELDFKARLWTIPAGRYKTGIPHTCALTEEAVAILKRRKAAASPGERFVFPAGNPKSKRGHFENYHTAWARVKELAGIDTGEVDAKDRLRVHDLRAAFATAMANAGLPAFDVRDQLGHRNIKTTMRYVRRSEEDKIRSVDRLSEHRRATSRKPAEEVA